MSDSETSETSTTSPLHDSFASPRVDDDDNETSKNPYHYLPEAPPRLRESSSSDDCFLPPRILSSKKPLSDRLFLDLVDEDEGVDETTFNRIVPISLAPAKRSMSRYERRRKMAPIAIKTSHNIKRQLAAVSSKPQLPRLSVSWIEKRGSNQQLLFLDSNKR